MSTAVKDGGGAGDKRVRERSEILNFKSLSLFEVNSGDSDRSSKRGALSKMLRAKGSTGSNKRKISLRLQP